MIRRRRQEPGRSGERSEPEGQRFAKRSVNSAPRARWRPHWLGLTIAVYALVAIASIGVARKAAEMRSLVTYLEDVRKTRDGHLEEYKYLLLERATIESYQDVERIAASELDMRFPPEVSLAR